MKVFCVKEFQIPHFNLDFKLNNMYEIFPVRGFTHL